MCNTNNTEQIRQQFWCDAFLQKNKEVSKSDSYLFADNALIEFDKRFNDKFHCKDSSITVKGVDIQKAVERFKNNQDSFE